MTTLPDDLPDGIYFKIERRPDGTWWGWAQHEEISEDARSGETETLAQISGVEDPRQCFELLLDLLEEDEES